MITHATVIIIKIIRTQVHHYSVRSRDSWAVCKDTRIVVSGCRIEHCKGRRESEESAKKEHRVRFLHQNSSCLKINCSIFSDRLESGSG